MIVRRDTYLNQGDSERELRPLLKVNDSFRRVLSTGGSMPPGVDEHGILNIGLLDFLMDANSLS